MRCNATVSKEAKEKFFCLNNVKKLLLIDRKVIFGRQIKHLPFVCMGKNDIAEWKSE